VQNPSQQCFKTLTFTSKKHTGIWNVSMDQSPGEANSHPPNQEIPCILWNLGIYNYVHEKLPLVPVLSQINPVHTLSTYFPKIYSNIILPSMFMSSRCSLPFRFSILYTVFISPMLLHNLPISSSLILSPFESVHFHNLSK